MPTLKTLKQHKVLFDTHVFLWHMASDPHLPPKFQKNIAQLQDFHPVLISPLNFWEISMLVEKGKISLEMDCMDWVEQTLSDPGFKLASFTPQITVLSSRLPGNLHRDPVDRMLIATAIENHAVLVTCDEKILSYGQNHFLTVHDPRA